MTIKNFLYAGIIAGAISALLSGCAGNSYVSSRTGIYACTVTADVNTGEKFVECGNGYVGTINNGKDGKDGVNGTNGTNGSSCSVLQLSNGAYVSCSDGTFAYIYNGVDGAAGSSCTASSVSGGVSIACGLNAPVVVHNGANGLNGTNGSNGTSCSVQPLSNGAKITCGSSVGYIYNGADGAPGASSGVLSVINPCGAEFAHDEVLLRMADGNILAVYDGNNSHDARLTLLVPGVSYETTDRNGTGCRFSVDSNLTLTDEHGNVFTR